MSSSSNAATSTASVPLPASYRSRVDGYVEQCKTALAEQLVTFTKLTLEQAKDFVEPGKEGVADYQLSPGKINKYYKLGAKPGDVCKEWASKLKTTDLITRVVHVEGVDNVQIDVQRLPFVQAVLDDVMEAKARYGCSNVGNGKTIVVEFSSPNIAKIFHAGHLRSTILGNFLQNVYRATGHNVISYNYLGDWGKQYGMLAIGFQRFGSRDELNKSAIRHLYDVYVRVSAEAAVEGSTINDEARAYFARMEAGDKEALALWSEFRELSIVEYKKIYARLGVTFDVFSGESQVSAGMDAAFDVMKAKNLLYVTNGATLIDLESHKKGLGKCLVKKSDGTSLYLTRDVAAAKERYDKHHFDEMIYVVGSQQNLHFKQLFKVLELMGYEWASKCVHVDFGMVNGMSTRRGTAVFLEDILVEAKQAMLDIMKENPGKFAEIDEPDRVADIIGMSAVIIQDLTAKRIKNYDFSWDRMLQSDGETGPYLQYSHARICSINRKAGVALDPKADASLLTEPHAYALAQQIAKFPQTLERSMQSCEPVTLVGYLFDLARAMNGAFVNLQVKGTEQRLAEARLLLLESARTVLNNGMRLLGLVPVERM